MSVDHHCFADPANRPHCTRIVAMENPRPVHQRGSSAASLPFTLMVTSTHRSQTCARSSLHSSRLRSCRREVTSEVQCHRSAVEPEISAFHIGRSSWSATRAFYSTLIAAVLLLAVSSRAVVGISRECLTSLETPNQKRFICISNPDFFPVLKYAEMIAGDECRRAFNNEAWNCSSFSLMKIPSIARDANKEAAYVHALSVAAIAHSIVDACNNDILSPSTCSRPDCGGTTLKCALTFAKQFLMYRYYSIGNKGSLDKHNFNAGKMALETIIEGAQPAPSCTCHGASGTCTVTTCQPLAEFVVPEFHVIGEQLKSLYSGACLVDSNGRTGESFSWIPNGCSFDDRVLLHNAHLPSHCTPDSRYGILGTAGRECDLHSDGPNSCQNLCGRCRLRVQEHNMVMDQKCECEFHFCCEIRCNTCRRQRTFYTCESPTVLTPH